MTPEQAFPIFMAVWIVLGIAGVVLFHVKRDVAFKRKYFPWFTAGAGIAFLCFIGLMGFPLAVFALAIPAVALITYLNIRGTRFCGACGRTLVDPMPFSKAAFCSKCGAPLGY